MYDVRGLFWFGGIFGKHLFALREPKGPDRFVENSRIHPAWLASLGRIFCCIYKKPRHVPCPFFLFFFSAPNDTMSHLYINNHPPTQTWDSISTGAMALATRYDISLNNKTASKSSRRQTKRTGPIESIVMKRQQRNNTGTNHTERGAWREKKTI